MWEVGFNRDQLQEIKSTKVHVMFYFNKNVLERENLGTEKIGLER